MASDTEQALVKAFKEEKYGRVRFGAFRHRQPEIPVNRGPGRSNTAKTSVIHPKQPIDLHVATTLVVSDDVIEEYDIGCYRVEDGKNKIDFRVGIEEKKTNGSTKNMKQAVKENRHQRFLDFCMLNALVPIYVVSFPNNPNVKPNPRNTKFDAECIKVREEFQKLYFEEDAKKFEDGFLEHILDLYFKNFEYWRGEFDEVVVSDV